MAKDRYTLRYLPTFLNDLEGHEKFGWQFLCMVQGDGDPDLTRMYIHR